MYKKLLLLFVLVSFISANIFAQRNCHANEVLDRQLADNPKMEQRMQQIEDFTNSFIQNNPNLNNRAAVITIPIVFHVVYNTNAENISDAQIMSQLQVLNDDFRRLNADASNTPSDFACLAADVEIEFCLAEVDPDGNPTTGITRTQTTVTSHGTNDSVKFDAQGGKDAWPSCDYLNFWICNIGGGILGYAQFPGGDPATDGVVNGYQYTGTIGTATAPFNLGRTATHEVGHWLNLRHIWGDGNCNADDFVTDTPLAGAANYTGAPCNYPGPNSCTDASFVGCNGTQDYADMFQNYMDYSDDACMNLFTLGQKARMLALFEPGGVRECLLGKDLIKCTPPVACPPTITGVDFTDEYCLDSQDGTITVNAISSVDLEYSIDGGPYQTSNTFTGLTAGTYTVEVHGVGENNSCVSSQQVTIGISNVIAPPDPVAGAAMDCGGPAEPLTATCSTCECAFDAATMTVEVEFNGSHSYVSDMAFFLQGPDGTIIPLGTQGNGCDNAGNDFSGLIFTNGAGANYDVCTLSTPLTGSYNSSGGGAFDFSPLNGSAFDAAGWNVIVVDCFRRDRGTLDSYSVTISGGCLASPITYSGTSGTRIPDNACDPASGLIEPVSFTVPPTTSDIIWWDAATGGNQVGMGTTFDPTTDTNFDITTEGTTTYYVECVCNGCASVREPVVATVNACSGGVLLSPKVFLQGPLSGTTMNTALMGGTMLPTASPYDGTPLVGTPPANVVDWVMVEIRSDDTASPAQVETASGLLLDDGTVVGPDGMSALSFPVAPGQSWFIVVKHRNHLGIMTNTAILLN